MQKIILASVSPRRKQLFSYFQLPFDVIPAELDESRQVNERPTDYVQRLARRKGEVVAAGHSGLIISADTIVVMDGEILGKPANIEEAERILRALRGREHQVHTALSLQNTETGEIWSDLVTSTVAMRNYSDDEMFAYLSSEDWRDKAGGYAIQHKGFHPCESVTGCETNVMGLPLCRMQRLLCEVGLAGADAVAACERELGLNCSGGMDSLPGE